MKHLSKLLVVTLLLVGAVSMQAQDENNPWQVSFGVNAIDVYPTSDDNFPTQTSSFGNELFNASDHWNILPSISYIGVSRSVGDNLSVGVRAVSYTHLRAHETDSYLVCRLLLEKKKNKTP